MKGGISGRKWGMGIGEDFGKLSPHLFFNLQNRKESSGKFRETGCNVLSSNLATNTEPKGFFIGVIYFCHRVVLLYALAYQLLQTSMQFNVLQIVAKFVLDCIIKLFDIINCSKLLSHSIFECNR